MHLSVWEEILVVLVDGPHPGMTCDTDGSPCRGGEWVTASTVYTSKAAWCCNGLYRVFMGPIFMC